MSIGLAAVEAWDVPVLRGAAGSLAEVPDRLGSWRLRLDGVRSQLHDAAWSGPAADVAAIALVELSAVAGQVQLALAESVEALGTVVAEADTARTEAEAARVVAVSGPVPLSDQGVVPPIAAAGMAPDQLIAVADRERAASWAEAHARLALAAADAALVAARTTGSPLAGVGVIHGVVPTGFAGVATAAAAIAEPPRVPDAGPIDAADWWAGLTPAARQSAIAADPMGVGALDGLPAWARDQANRLLLDDALSHPAREGYAVAVETADQLAGLDTGQLLLFVPGEDLVALSVGDLDTAGAVGILVPGMNTSPDDDLAGMTEDATAVGELAAAAVPGLAVATLVWMGYQTPRAGSFYLSLNARSSGPELDRTLDGLAAARTGGAQGGGAAVPRTTVVAHSYGSVVAGYAARAGGELAADAVVVLGSPGMPVQDADGLEADEVYGAWSASDAVAWSHGFGMGPIDPGFGDTGLPTDVDQGHTHYYDPGFPTLEAIAEVVAGTRETG